MFTSKDGVFLGFYVRVLTLSRLDSLYSNWVDSVRLIGASSVDSVRLIGARSVDSVRLIGASSVDSVRLIGASSVDRRAEITSMAQKFVIEGAGN